MIRGSNVNRLMSSYVGSFTRTDSVHFSTENERILKILIYVFIQDWLKPGGKLFITDYCCTDGAWSDMYAAYVKQRGYILLSPKAYGKVSSLLRNQTLTSAYNSDGVVIECFASFQLLEEVGFVDVRAEDRTEQFVKVLHSELYRLESIKQQFLKVMRVKTYPDKMPSSVCDKQVTLSIKLGSETTEFHHKFY